MQTVTDAVGWEGLIGTAAFYTAVRPWSYNRMGIFSKSVMFYMILPQLLES